MESNNGLSLIPDLKEALNDFETELKNGFTFVESDNRRGFYPFFSSHLKKILEMNVSFLGKITGILESYDSQVKDMANQSRNALKKANETSMSTADTVKLAHSAYIDRKLDDQTALLKRSKCSLIIHKFPANITGSADQIGETILATLNSLDLPKFRFSLLAKAPKENSIPIKMDFMTFEDKVEAQRILASQDYVSSPFYPANFHSLAKKIRPLYMNADLNSLKIGGDSKQITIRTNMDCNRIVVLGRNYTGGEWTKIESLEFPIPRKFVSTVIQQKCKSKYVMIDSIIPNDF